MIIYFTSALDHIACFSCGISVYFFKCYSKIKLALKDEYMALKLLVDSPEDMLMTADPMQVVWFF